MSPGPEVLLLALGGTISMTGTAGAGVQPTLTADDLRPAGGPAIRTIDVRTVPGAHLTLDDLLDVAQVVRDAAATGTTGVVITQGTDTIEETAAALDLLLDLDLPVVVTGAMRNPAAAGADGPANVADAVAVALDPGCRGLGVLVVLAGTIHAASLVRKAHTAAPEAFTSHPGALGWVAEGRPVVALVPRARPRLPAIPAALPDGLRVPVVTASLGDDGLLLHALLSDVPTALVVEGFGVGHVPPSFLDPITELAARIPVVLCSRARAGTVFTGTYGFAGSETDLLRRGCLPGGAATAARARITAALLLAGGGTREQLAATLDPSPSTQG